MFKAGQKIVCIKTSSKKKVIEGEIYTVVKMTFGGMGVMLVEVQSEYVTNGFMAYLFRPIDNTWAEEVLCKLLEEMNADELVDA